ncbi:glycerol-3-phosphate dehydrogenase [Rhodoligotrophos appendicifer]|uniref:glycerol-3-phosphate dehydrogenase n=1 Tax=Rhodoligotrophos appendicifer TaxID=987056 RepID=UPI001180016E|nr:glycerol-3-phosphate dehydrogenase [Rhodoligotrophos appendicifer]
MQNGIVDIAVIGGGINGCGIARDAAGRGLSVFLCEKGDLAGSTSSASTKLIHGGLRYLEYYEFRLVREALIEREVLLRAAPHIIWPLRFVLPHHKGLRPAWLIRLGLFLYDHLGGRKLLPPSRSLDLRTDVAGRPLKPDFVKAMEYSDCWVDDARLVALTAMDAKARGADIRTRSELVAARRGAESWTLTLRDAGPGAAERIEARVLVNAAGPWVSRILSDQIGQTGHSHVRLVKGSHIVVRKLFDHDRAYIFQNADNRIVFAIPYEHDFTLIGTTDVDYVGDPGTPTITPEEIDYLCTLANDYFVRPISAEDVVRTYSGVRPLYDDGASDAQAATRDYVLELDDAQGQAPLLTVYGGKITTFRRLSEHALEKLEPCFPGLPAPWTHEAPLPGGDFPVDGYDALVARLIENCPSCPAKLAQRLVRAYGTRAARMLEGVRTEADWGRRFGADLTEREVRYLMDNEWAQTAEDVVWRRSKLGYRMSAAEIEALDAWMRIARGLEPAQAQAAKVGAET